MLGAVFVLKRGADELHGRGVLGADAIVLTDKSLVLLSSLLVHEYLLAGTTVLAFLGADAVVLADRSLSLVLLGSLLVLVQEYLLAGTRVLACGYKSTCSTTCRMR